MTFASKITIGRICLVPVFAALAFYYGHTVDAGQPVEALRWWALGVLRDCIILGGIRILWNHRRRVKFAPHWTGKICTVTQMFAIGWVMLRVTWLPPLYPCLVAGFFTVWSGIAYVQQGRRILRGLPA